MNIDRFHLTLTVALAGVVGFGAAHWLQPDEAHAYPSGTAVSYGANPVFSVGGTVIPSGDVLETPALGSAGQDAIITDVVLSFASNGTLCYTSYVVELQDATGSLADVAFSVWETDAPHVEHVSLGAGVRVADGETLSVFFDEYTGLGKCTTGVIAYTLSGYYAQP